MANSDQAILREYLVALGFKINETEHKKFVGQVAKTDVRMGALSKTIVGAATSVVTFTTLFAKSMERLYYSSRYAGSSAANMKALEFGAQQIGLKAGQASSAVTNMAAALRANPGLVGLLTGKFGIQVAGRKMDEVLVDLVKVLRTMPPYIGQQFAALFGIDPETLFNLSLGLEKMEEAKQLQKDMAKEMGVNLDEAAKMGVEYGNTWRTMTTQASLFVDLLGIFLMPKMREVASVTHEVMNDWAGIVREMNKTGSQDFWTRYREGLGLQKHEPVKLTPEAALRVQGPVPHATSPFSWLGIPRMIEDWQIWRAQRDQKRNGGAPRLGPDAAPPAAPPAAGPSSETPDDQRQARLRELEKKYALPEGILDRIWNKESGRGQAMLSTAGAQGHFGFMPKTAAQYGLRDPNNFEQSSDAAARMMRDMIQGTGGNDIRAATAAYNWGLGNVLKYGLGKAPAETRDYMDTVAGPAQQSITQNTDIHIHGAEKPHEAADAVYEVMESINAETVRNFKPTVR